MWTGNEIKYKYSGRKLKAVSSEDFEGKSRKQKKGYLI